MHRLPVFQLETFNAQASDWRVQDSARQASASLTCSHQQQQQRTVLLTGPDTLMQPSGRDTAWVHSSQTKAALLSVIRP